MQTGADGPLAGEWARPVDRLNLAQVWITAILADLRTRPFPEAATHGLRRLRMLLAPGEVSGLAGSRSLAAHAAAEEAGDRLFCLSHRHYLARDLTARNRITAAACHYSHQDSDFTEAYFRAVYLEGGLCLWRGLGDGPAYDIVLRKGCDVADEGGLSLVLQQDGASLCVLSFSLVPGRMLARPGGPALPPLVWFLTRKHLSFNHAYQQDFHRAFHRVSAAQMVFAAFSGMARQMGHDLAMGIGAGRHPSGSPGRAAQFETAYDQFWLTMGATPAGPDFLIRLPVPQRPLEEMDAAHRKRARQRRAVQKEVEDSAAAVLAPLMRGGST